MTSPETTTPPTSFAQGAAHVVSTATSPYITAALTGALVVYLLHPTLAQALMWGAVCLLFAAVLPFAFVYVLWRTGGVTDLHVALRRQRSAPFLAAIASVACGMVVLYALHAPRPLLALGVVFLANALPLTLLSLRWKMSAHTAVYTAGVFAVALLGHPEALWALALVPVILWARVYRKRHTLGQGLVPVVMTAVLSPLAYHATLWLVGR
jgi:hypothetical protein